MASLNLNYKPRIVVDTSGLSEDEWLNWRRKGIGGSDVAAVFGVSPFKTMRDLYNDKKGIAPVRDTEEDNWVALEYGNLLEDLVARVFTFKTGLKASRRKILYAHPLYPFMQANLDFVLDLPGGEQGILECKTTSYMNRDHWAEGAVPYMYELQVRHYMAVMNLNVVYIACLYGNNASSFVYRKIERDLETEEDIIYREKQFWEKHVKADVRPPYVEETELVLKSLRRYLEAANKEARGITLEPDMAEMLEEYLNLSKQKSKLSAEERALEKKMKALTLPFIEQLGPVCSAVCEGTGGKYRITYNPVSKTAMNKDSLMRLKEAHPDIYKEYAKTTEHRQFSVKKVEEENEEESAA